MMIWQKNSINFDKLPNMIKKYYFIILSWSKNKKLIYLILFMKILSKGNFIKKIFPERKISYNKVN